MNKEKYGLNVLLTFSPYSCVASMILLGILYMKMTHLLLLTNLLPIFSLDRLDFFILLF